MATMSLWPDVLVESRRVPHPDLSELRSLSELADSKSVLARLAAIDWSFTDDNTSYLAHDVHPYPAKFIPQIPTNLISALSLRGEVVWDPFGGSGTTALEALLLGRQAISSDVNPLATLITLVKCTALAPEQRDVLRSLAARVRALADERDVTDLLNRSWKRSFEYVPAVPNIEHWFAPTVLRELAHIRSEIDTLDDEASERFALVALSSIVVAVSNQDGETRYARRDKKLPPGKTLRLFSQALQESLAKHEPLEDLLGYRRPHALTLDARDGEGLPKSTLPDDSVDLVVTSPPYANATDYHLYHRFRLFWMGFDPRQLAQNEVGSHLRHQREKRGFDLYAADMTPVLKSVARRLRVGRYAVFVVGDAVFEKKTISTAAALSDVARDAGLEVVGVVTRPVHSTRRSFIAPARRTRSEDLLVLRRPPRRLAVTFHPAPYKMWPYEEDLRRRELANVVGVRAKKSGAATAELSCYELDRAQRLAFTHRVETLDGGGSRRTWQAILENGDAEAGRKDPKYVTHGIHPYKGKFYPQLCKGLMNLANLEPGARILDPFCGSGTVLLEAQLNGHLATGLDMHPLAVLISQAKTAIATTSAVVLDRALKDFVDRIVADKSSAQSLDYFPVHLHEEIGRWFPRPVAHRLGWLLATIDRVPNSAASLVLRVLLSSIIRQVSQQEPADLRIRKRKQPLEDAPVLALLRARIDEFRDRLRKFGARMSAAPVSFAPARVIEADSRDERAFASLAPVDCVITSPPYATALPYIDTDRLSLLTLLGLASAPRSQLEQALTGSREIREQQRRELEGVIETEGDLERRLRSKTASSIVRHVFRLNRAADVGFRRRNMAALLYRYFDDMRSVFTNLSRIIRPGGRLFFVIGDNKTLAGERSVEIRSGQVLAELGEAMKWKLTDTLPISVTKEALLNSHHAITENAVLCFEAPQARSRR